MLVFPATAALSIPQDEIAAVLFFLALTGNLIAKDVKDYHL